jgi:hypothetical protein
MTPIPAATLHESCHIASVSSAVPMEQNGFAPPGSTESKLFSGWPLTSAASMPAKGQTGSMT